MLPYAEYMTAVHNLWSPSHRLGRCSEEDMLSATEVQCTHLLLFKRNTFNKRITVNVNIHCHLPRARDYATCLPWITSSSSGDNSLDRDKYRKRRKQGSWGIYSFPWQVAEQGILFKTVLLAWTHTPLADGLNHITQTLRKRWSILSYTSPDPPLSTPCLPLAQPGKQSRALGSETT